MWPSPREHRDSSILFFFLFLKPCAYLLPAHHLLFPDSLDLEFSLPPAAVTVADIVIVLKGSRHKQEPKCYALSQHVQTPGFSCREAVVQEDG